MKPLAAILLLSRVWMINGEPWYWSPWVEYPIIAIGGGCWLASAILGFIIEVRKK